MPKKKVMMKSPKPPTSQADKADPETHNEVDLMILDYLLCTAINALLKARIAERNDQSHDCNADGLLSLVTSFTSTIPTDVVECPLPWDLELKLRLFAFTKTFLGRYTHSARYDQKNNPFPGRENNIDATATPPLPEVRDEESPSKASENSRLEPAALDKNYRTMALQLKISTTTRDVHCRATLIPLSEMTSEFVSICSLATAMISETRRLDLLARFMMQASMERYLVFGDASREMVSKGFAWSPEGLEHDLKWTQKRRRYMKYLQPHLGCALSAHLENVLEKFPLYQFEGLVIEFLNDILAMLEPPILLQLERGQLYGLTRVETQELKSRVGF